IDFLEASDARGRLARIRDGLHALLANAQRGALLRDGLNVVLLGEPNVGKSSLLNALAGAEGAIVTEIPGTTRGRIAQAVQVAGGPLPVADTAGRREATDQVEQRGVARSWAEAARADVVGHLLDGRAPDRVAARAIEQELDHRRAEPVPLVRVYNKIDLAE